MRSQLIHIKHIFSVRAHWGVGAYPSMQQKKKKLTLDKLRVQGSRIVRHTFTFRERITHLNCESKSEQTQDRENMQITHMQNSQGQTQNFAWDSSADA